MDDKDPILTMYLFCSSIALMVILLNFFWVGP